MDVERLFLPPKQEIWTETKVDSEGDGPSLEVVTISAVDCELGAKTIGGREAMGVVNGGVSRMHPSKSLTRITDGECAKVGHSVKIRISTGNADIAHLSGKLFPKRGGEVRVKRETCVERPKGSMLLIREKEVRFSAYGGKRGVMRVDS